MLVRIIKYIKGYVFVRVIGYSPERFINLCSNHDILLWDIKNEGESYTMYMSINGFRRIKPILKKTKTRLVIEKRHGLPFFLHKYRKRKMFFAGILLCLIMVYILSLFIWNINIEGNASRTDDVIMDYLEKEETYHGILKKRVDCEKIVANIRKEFDDIIWASAEIRGTRLLIKVKENTDTKVIEELEEEPSDIVADKDGIITEIITRSGVPQVGVGSVVKKGEVLVSGRIEVLDDAGEVSEYQYSPSDSDIYAKTVYDYEEVLPLAYVKKTYTEETKKGYFLRIFDKKINIWGNNHNFKEYDSVTEENQWKMGENFYIPISTGNYMYKEYHSSEEVYSEEEAISICEEQLSIYLKELEEKGVQIIENNVKIQVEKNDCTAKGKIQVIEKIGKRADTELLENPADKKEKDEEE